MRVTKAISPGLPPGTGASQMWILSLSPEFISSVRELGVSVARVVFCGLGGPVGTPSVCTKAKFVGSMQLSLHSVKPHSRSLMCSYAHQWALSQLRPSTNGPQPGG